MIHKLRHVAIIAAILTHAHPARCTDAPSKPADLDPLIRLIASSTDPTSQRDLLVGTLEAVEVRRRVPMPSAWSEVSPKLIKSPDADVRDAATRLALVFGDPAAFASLRATAVDPSAPKSLRIGAIEALARARDGGLAPVLQGLLSDPSVRGAALRGLAATDDDRTSGVILRAYPTFDPDAKANAIGTVAARTGSALALLDAVGKGTIARSEIFPSALQALAGHTDARVKAALAKLFGAVRPTPDEKKSTIARLRAGLTPVAVAGADASRGRAVFARQCASCHTLFDAGGKIGPELTGSQRNNLDYVLANVVDPSAVVGGDYQVTVFSTADGRVVSGIIRREDERSVAVQTANELVVIPKTEIEGRRKTGESMMPEGLLGGLGRDEVRDLVGYLASPGQVPLPTESTRR